ncbi:hypothetical protein SAMN02927923_01441 [Microvirga guangxiensis]|uniref:Uncharacterized protein n=1 Tax=Microvirga guangxiensis TaxID=549386 RepID=A0A1G5GB71_9HYPH|nr:hypothetical protein SAMN02927923_01441 [Microvirga guangxiensis]
MSLVQPLTRSIDPHPFPSPQGGGNTRLIRRRSRLWLGQMQCSYFVLDFGPKLGYILACPDPLRGALARRRMCGVGSGPVQALTQRLDGRPIAERRGVRLNKPCVRGRQVLHSFHSEPDASSRPPSSQTSEQHAREDTPACSLTAESSTRPGPAYFSLVCVQPRPPSMIRSASRHRALLEDPA